MKNLITEINRNRVLMGLEVINEGTGLAGIIDAIANGLASNMVKKVTTEIVDSFPAIFKYDLNTAAGKAARTKFINGGLASLKSALAKISRKEALEIIVKVDTAQVAKLASLIEKEETELMAQIGSLVEKGVEGKTIKKSLGELTDIPDSVVSVLINKVSIEKLFTVERITELLKAMEKASGKNFNKLRQTAIDAYRTSNPGITELEIAEKLANDLPYSLLSAKRMQKLVDAGGANFARLIDYLFKDKKNNFAWKRIMAIGGVSLTIGALWWAKEYLFAYLPEPKSPIDKLEQDPRYSCYAGYITPGKDENHFVVVDENNKRQNVLYKDGRFWFIDKTGNIISELKCQ